jgi:hypothetical protein
MGEILRFVAISFLILLILALAIPLLWLVIKMVVWLFGGMLAGITIAGDVIWVLIFIVSIVVIIWCISN